jgi:hypothetical protein
MVYIKLLNYLLERIRVSDYSTISQLLEFGQLPCYSVIGTSHVGETSLMAGVIVKVFGHDVVVGITKSRPVLVNIFRF